MVMGSPIIINEHIHTCNSEINLYGRICLCSDSYCESWETTAVCNLSTWFTVNNSKSDIFQKWLYNIVSYFLAVSEKQERKMKMGIILSNAAEQTMKWQKIPECCASLNLIVHRPRITSKRIEMHNSDGTKVNICSNYLKFSWDICSNKALSVSTCQPEMTSPTKERQKKQPPASALFICAL